MTEEYVDQGGELDTDDEQGQIHYLMLAHSISDVVTGGKAQAGDLYVKLNEDNIVTLELDGKPGCEVVCWLPVLTRRWSVEGETKCQGQKVDGVWRGAGAFQGKECEKCSHWNDEAQRGVYIKDACRWRWNFFLKVLDGWTGDGVAPCPVLASMEGPSGGEAFRYIKSIFVRDADEKGRPVFWKSRIRLSSRIKSRRDGKGKYHVWVAEHVGTVETPLMVEASQQYQQMKDTASMLLSSGESEVEDSDDDKDLPF